MKLCDFELLSDEEKIDVLYHQGVYLGKRKDHQFTVVLYQVESFYIEIYYEKYRRYISRIHTFSSTALLDPYLEQIDVEHLV